MIISRTLGDCDNCSLAVSLIADTIESEKGVADAIELLDGPFYCGTFDLDDVIRNCQAKVGKGKKLKKRLTLC